MEKIKKVFEDEQGDWCEEMLKEEQQEIEIGLAQADKNDCIAHETVMNPFYKWH